MSDVATPHYERIKQFMILAGQATPEVPCDPGIEVRELRAKLILEEALETVRGLGVSVTAKFSDVAVPLVSFDGWADGFLSFCADGPFDIVEVADGCADLSVVNTGTLIACGIKDAELLDAVDENNLAKFQHICPKCGTEQDDSDPDVQSALQSVGAPSEDNHADAVGLRVCLNQDCGHTWRSGYRRADGKWVKPEGHEPPDVLGVLTRQGYVPSEDV